MDTTLMGIRFLPHSYLKSNQIFNYLIASRGICAGLWIQAIWISNVSLDKKAQLNNYFNKKTSVKMNRDKSSWGGKVREKEGDLREVTSCSNHWCSWGICETEENSQG